MPDPHLDTVYLRRCVERWQAGDRAAADELVRAAGERLEYLARRMLKGFPNVRGVADTADVLQGSLMRLLHTLRNLQPASTRDFFNLATAHVRRELLDLARRARFRPPAVGRAGPDDGPPDPLTQAADAGPCPEELERWCRFHEAVAQLPVEEREVIGLVYYHGWSRVQVAELFQIDERTVRRRWVAAARKLRQLLGELPPS